VRHVTWFLGAVENFRFFDATVHPFADPGGAVAEVKAEALIKATGRTYRQVAWCSCVPNFSLMSVCCVAFRNASCSRARFLNGIVNIGQPGRQTHLQLLPPLASRADLS